MHLLFCVTLLLPTATVAQGAEEPATVPDTPPVASEPLPAPEASREVETRDPEAATTGSPGKDRPGGIMAGNEFALSLDGHLRLEAGSLLPDRFLGVLMPARYKRESPPNVGRNDGFALGAARLNLRGELGDILYVRLAFDGALTTFEDDSPVGDLKTGLKDAYVRYTFARLLEVSAGRFKPPFDIESLTPSEQQMFVHSALESRGVARHEGPHADLFGNRGNRGFAPGRQLGLMLTGETGEGMSWGYALAITNGNTGDASLNDNDLLAVYLRLFGALRDIAGPANDEEGPATYEVSDGLVVGISGFYNETATGLAPTRFRDRITGAGIDAAYTLSVFTLQGQVLAARTSPVTRTDVPGVTSFGGHLQLAVQVPGMALYPAYRFAYFDPRVVSDEEATAGSDEDRVMHHTIGVRFSPERLPLVLHLEFTHSVEQKGRATQNDRVEAAMQVTF